MRLNGANAKTGKNRSSWWNIYVCEWENFKIQKAKEKTLDYWYEKVFNRRWCKKWVKNSCDSATLCQQETIAIKLQSFYSFSIISSFCLSVHIDQLQIQIKSQTSYIIKHLFHVQFIYVWVGVANDSRDKRWNNNRYYFAPAIWLCGS